MSRGKEQAKAFQVTIRDVLALIVGMCLSLGCLRMGVTLKTSGPGWVIPLSYLGFTLFSVTIGAFLGKFRGGSYQDARNGAWIGFLATAIIGPFFAVLFGMWHFENR